MPAPVKDIKTGVRETKIIHKNGKSYVYLKGGASNKIYVQGFLLLPTADKVQTSDIISNSSN